MRAKLTQSQVAGIHASLREGRLLARGHPEIADEWKGGLSYEQLARKYLSHLIESIGASAVGYAIRRLIPKKERDEIKSQRLLESGRRLGLHSKKKGEGIFSMSEKEKTTVRVRGGKNAALLRGQILYDGEKRSTEFGKITEREYIENLIRLRKENPRLTWKLITLHVNAIFGNNRTWISVKLSQKAMAE